MKRIIALLLILLCHLAYAQNGQLPHKVRTDFCRNAYINYKYGSDAFKAWMIQSARNIGLTSLVEIQTAIENICNNKELQDDFFKTAYRIGGSRDFIFSQFLSIDMTAENAKILTDYLIAKYGTVVSTKIVDEEYIKDTTVIEDGNLLRSLYPKGQLQSDTSITYRQNTIGVENNQAVYNAKIIRQFLFEKSSNNVNDEPTEILAVILKLSLIKSSGEKSKPYCSVLLFNKIGQGEQWKLSEQHHHLNLDELNVSDVKFKIEDGVNLLLFTDSINGITTKSIVYNIENMYASPKTITNTHIVTTNSLEQKTDEEIQPFNTTKCKALKSMSLLAKSNVNSAKLYLLPKDAIVYVYMEWKGEEPGKFVRCVYYDKAGKEHKGYVISSSLEWLQAG
ncbi:MAG: hypothetical protein JST62_07320 [Bacteroidetes bacterium]|nr:hypothetical protein [Bacteroidota bacterium]